MNADFLRIRNKKIFLCSLADIGKRLKLQQFIAKKANVLYDKVNLEPTVEATKPQLGGPGIINIIFISRF